MAPPRKSRALSEQEKALWKMVADSTNRLSPLKLPAEDTAPKTPRKTDPVSAEKPQTRPFRVGENTRGTHFPAPLPLTENAPSMDAKAYRRMQGGKIAPEARLDLHGLTLAQAQPRLTRFILDSAHQGRRLVLVITGKGRGSREDVPMPVRPGALRHNVPHWLSSMPLKPHVLQVSEAHRRHGGQGAYYVYLRRVR